jgi:magnesium transporter
MIKRYYAASSDTKLEVTKKAVKGSWLHAESPTQEEISHLVATFKLVPGHLEDALDEDEAPRLEMEGEQMYIYTRFAVREKDGDFETVPLLIIRHKDAVITIASRHVAALEPLTTGRIPITTSEQTRLILQIMQRITEQYDNLIDKTSRKIKAVRQRLRTHAVTNQDFVDFVLIEDELNEFLTALQPNNAVLRRLLVGHRLVGEDQDLVEDVLLMNEQSVEKCNSNIKSIIGVRDAHSSISDNSLNQTMKVLTVATLGMAIPNMIFGIYSMNVETPFQHSFGAFWIIVSFTTIVLVAVMWFGRKKNIF